MHHVIAELVVILVHGRGLELTRSKPQRGRKQSQIADFTRYLARSNHVMFLQTVSDRIKSLLRRSFVGCCWRTMIV